MPSLPVLVLNSGSSSIKFSVYEADGDERRRLYEGAVDGIGTDLGKFWIKDANGAIVRYLNRLSDFCWVLARFVERKSEPPSP